MVARRVLSGGVVLLGVCVGVWFGRGGERPAAAATEWTSTDVFGPQVETPEVLLVLVVSPDCRWSVGRRLRQAVSRHRDTLQQWFDQRSEIGFSAVAVAVSSSASSGARLVERFAFDHEVVVPSWRSPGALGAFDELAINRRVTPQMLVLVRRGSVGGSARMVASAIGEAEIAAWVASDSDLRRITWHAVAHEASG